MGPFVMRRGAYLFTAVLLAVGSTLPALGQTSTCNGFIGIGYPVVATPNTPGSIDRVRLSVSAGDINGGSFFDVTSLGFDLDCRDRGCSNNLSANCTTSADCGPGGVCLQLGTTCIDDGAIMQFEGNVTNTCGSTITPTVNGNRVTFTASPVIRVAENGPSCSIEFNISPLVGASNDTTPNFVEQVGRILSGQCDNGLGSAAAQSGAIRIDPPPTPTPTATSTATVTSTPTATPDCLPPGAPCADDGDPCTVDKCSVEGVCAHTATIESPDCDTCKDGIDNDGDSDIDCRDTGCSLFADLQDFGIIALRSTGNKNVRIGGNVNVENVESEHDLSVAGVCSRSLDIRGGSTIGALAVTMRATFGRGETGERIISIRENFASPPTAELRMAIEPPFVGPGTCESSMMTCGDDFDCGLSGGCENRLTLTDPANPRVDRDGTSELLDRCENSLVATNEATVCLESIPCTPVSLFNVTPSSAAARDNLRATKSAPSVHLQVGSGLQVVCVNQLKLGPDGPDFQSELVIDGQPDTILVMRVRRMTLGAQSEVVLNGVPPSQVLWYLPGRGGGPKMSRASTLPGTIFAPERSQVFFGGETSHSGAVIGNRVKVLRAAQVRHDPFCALVCEP